MKKIVLVVCATLVVALTVTTFFAFTAKKTTVETEQQIDNPLAPKLDAETTRTLLAQTGGYVYFTVPANTATWRNTGNWSTNPSNPPCTGTGNICRVLLNAGQTLQQFLDANEGESYSDMLNHPQIDQKA